MNAKRQALFGRCGPAMMRAIIFFRPRVLICFILRFQSGDFLRKLAACSRERVSLVGLIFHVHALLFVNKRSTGHRGGASAVKARSRRTLAAFSAAPERAGEMATKKMDISVPADLRQRIEALHEKGIGDNWSKVAAEALERAVAFREEVNGIGPKTKYDLLVIMAWLVPVMTDAELSKTLKMIADRLLTAPDAERRPMVLNRFKRGEVPTKPPHLSN